MKDHVEHDNTDRDIIIINKDSLILKLFKSKEFYNSINSAFGFGGISVALIFSGYLTETFHNIGFIPGETIRSIFIVLGLVFLGLCIKSTISYFKLRNTNDPVKIIASLLKEEEEITIQDNNNYIKTNIKNRIRNLSKKIIVAH